MLPRERRIPRKLWKSIIEAPKEQSKYYSSDNFSLKATPSLDSKVRLAVSVSKKVSKKAVVRNRVRRRAYSASAPLLSLIKPNLYLISAKPGSEKSQGENLKKEIESLFLKGGFIVSKEKKD